MLAAASVAVKRLLPSDWKHMAIRDEVLAAIDADRLLGLLREMLRFRSFSASAGELDLARWLAAELTQRGLEVSQQHITAERVNTLAWLRGSAAGPSLMLNGHIDTNMPGLGWTRDPWGADIEDGFVYGLGASNMKAADAAMIEAVTAVREAAPDLQGDVCLAMVVGELQGGIGTLQLLRDGIATDYFIVGEPTDLAMLTLHAGSFEFTIDVIGRTRHMSKMEEAVNAVTKMGKVVDTLTRLQFPAGGRAEYAALDRLNVGSIRGGVGPEAQDWRAPLVPDFCSIRVAARFAPDQTPQSVIADVENALRELQQTDPELDFNVTLSPPEVKHVMPPFEVATDDPFIQRMAANHRALAGLEPALGGVAPYRYYGTDAGHLATRGMRGLVYGPGGAFNTMADERVAIADILLAAKAYAVAILDTCCSLTGHQTQE
jgi:acetylornithine deacetylase